MSNEPSKHARITNDCFAAIVRAFMESPKFMGYSESTKDTWSRELRFVARPDCLGMVSRQDIRPALVQAVIDGLTGRPGKQAALYAALKQLEKWAVVRDLLPRQIVLGVETEDSDGGHIPWSNEQVAIGEKYARPDLARAVTLGANTGQRGSDLIRMTWSDLEVYKGREGINVIQKKTGLKIWVPITSALAAAIQTWDRSPGPFLRRPNGTVWSRHDLSNAWAYERERNPELAGLQGLVLHGLRGHACVRLLRAGANTRQISDMVGMSEPMVSRYTRFSQQRDNATAAVFHMENVPGTEKRYVQLRSKLSD